MKIVVVYIFPMGGSGPYLDMAVKFLETYNRFPAGLDHDSVVVCNGARADEATRFLFGSMKNPKFIEHDNSGYDCGGFQKAAREHPCELMVFFGASSYLRGQGWLVRMMDSFIKHGPGLYGVMGNRGDDRFGVWPHIRTTGFWMSPELMNKYPLRVTRPDQRYPMEHGPDCLTSWITRIGLRARVVSWTGEYLWDQWDSFPGGYHRGQQENMIAGDKLTCPPYYHCD